MRTAATAFGIVMLLVGIAGYIDALTPDGRLLGLFAVNGVHNIVHIATGIAGIATGATSWSASRTFFRAFTVIYALVTILGFFVGDGMLLGVMAHNGHDLWLHVLITLFAGYFGFVARPERYSRAA